ncbi:hypothetical protein GCM10022280_15710 [Sphingomonas swuensis]|uniref:Peptidase M15A C-terminal domain-containing protein n=1 Tax=Sphingomonas swuensis TaxID=977800 RepID=A0ABP7SW96_9SPHN
MFASLILLAGVQSATDFGVRVVGGHSPVLTRSASTQAPSLPSAAPFSLATASRIGARFGRITSTWRSASRNRLVGGVPNSWHLQGRAIDIARHPSVRHSEIAAELRRNGLYLIESLDEGDHSHFAFASGPLPSSRRRSIADQIAETRAEASYFRFVTVPARLRETAPGRSSGN